jgi:RHS repeat-associated protein
MAYPSKNFEIRAHDAPTKYVFNGDTRVALVTGSLSSRTRVQRLRLYPGWNLCSIAVAAPNALSQISSPESTIAAYKWNPASSNWVPIANAETLPAATVLWLKCLTNTIATLTGTYAEPTNITVSPGNSFIPAAGLEAWSSTNLSSADASVWTYDTPSGTWLTRPTPAIPSRNTLPDILSPGQAISGRAVAPSQIKIPDPALRMLYYHQDHLGSSACMTDADGGESLEAGYYPYGAVRIELSQASSDNYTFAQKEQDAESGLDYSDQRYLHPSLGRFVSCDLVTVSKSQVAPGKLITGAYEYCANRPTILIDPTGTTEEYANHAMGVPASGDKGVTAYDALFATPGGQKFQETVEEVAKKMGVNPGLLAVVALSESPNGNFEPYLRSGAVSSFEVGTDDFFEKQADIRRKVPAASEISAKTTYHTDVNETGRTVKSVDFASGREALFAVAAYLKHGEMSLRERAQQLGGDFGKLSGETQFALTRIAYHAGIGKANSVLAKALQGQDVLIRSPAHWGPQRAATVRAAQSIHVSGVIFGE